MVIGSVLLIVAAIVLLAYGLIQGSNAAFVASIAASLMAAVALIAGGRQASAQRSAQREADRRAEDRLGAEAEPSGSAGRGAGLTEAQRTAGGGERESVMEAGSGEPPEFLDHGLAHSSDSGRVDRSDAREAATGQTALLAPVRDQPEGPRADQGIGDHVIPAQGSRADARPGAALGIEDAGVQDASVEGSSLAEDEYGPDDADPPNEPPAQPTSPTQAARVARMTTPVLVVDGRPRYHQRTCVHLVGRSSEPLPVNEAMELGFTPCGLCDPDSALLLDTPRV